VRVFVNAPCIWAKGLGQYFALREVLPVADCVDIEVVEDRGRVCVVDGGERPVGIFAQRGSYG
jgi:hypothetical protein